MINNGFAFIVRWKVDGFDATKKGLLIGYDMMPLIGLRNMERRLKKQGSIKRVKLVCDPSSKEWGAVKNGVCCMAFASWQGGLSRNQRRAFQSLAGFCLDKVSDDSDRRLLYRLWTPTMYRRRAPKQERAAREVIKALGYDVVRMRFVSTELSGSTPAR